MPRPARILEEGMIYHVYNRVGGEEDTFSDEALAARFVQLLRKVAERDEMVVYAWALMSNHYHLVVRMGAVPLSRSMKTLQQEVTRTRNRKAKVDGHLWQGRYKAKRVDREDYLGRLIAYTHLNPVKAGIVDRPRKYRWSGHRDVLGMRKRPIVSIDDVLAIFGESRRASLAAYRLALRLVAGLEWSGEAPGRLPWWRLGRPSADDELRPGGSAMADELGRGTSPYRRRFEAEEWLALACGHLEVERADIAGRGRQKEVVRARELLGLIGVGLYGVRVKDLARELGKSEDGVSLWVRRGAQRRLENAPFAAAAEDLDSAAREER
jgi:REP element-mobilizing transposase RayT